MKSRLLVVLVLLALVFSGMAMPREANAAKAFCHTVRYGENITIIARSYGVTVQAVKKANEMWSNTIYAGQCLLIPGYGGKAVKYSSSSRTKVVKYKCTKIHVVKRGQYVKSIARKYGVRPQAIIRANYLKNPNKIYVGQRLKIPTVCTKKVIVKKPGPQPCPPAQGAKSWYAQYWNNQWMSGPPKWATWYQAINLNFGYNGPGDGINGYNFASRFTRDRYFNTTGTYRFFIRTDDGARLWVDGVKIIDEWHNQAPTTYAVDREITAGTHHIQIDHYQNTGVAQIRFWVERVSGGGGAWPPSGGGGQGPWTCNFYNNTQLNDPIVNSRQYQSLHLDWGRYSPASGVTADFFSARCTTDQWFGRGNYHFKVGTDDGVRVWVDDNLILDQWRVQGVTYYGADVFIEEGNHRVKVEYFENMGRAYLTANWAPR